MFPLLWDSKPLKKRNSVAFFRGRDFVTAEAAQRGAQAARANVQNRVPPRRKLRLPYFMLPLLWDEKVGRRFPKGISDIRWMSEKANNGRPCEHCSQSAPSESQRAKSSPTTQQTSLRSFCLSSFEQAQNSRRSLPHSILRQMAPGILFRTNCSERNASHHFSAGPQKCMVE